MAKNRKNLSLYICIEILAVIMSVFMGYLAYLYIVEDKSNLGMITGLLGIVVAVGIYVWCRILISMWGDGRA